MVYVATGVQFSNRDVTIDIFGVYGSIVIGVNEMNIVVYVTYGIDVIIVN